MTVVQQSAFSPNILSKEETVTFPLDYCHDTQLEKFSRKVTQLKTTISYNENLTDQHFSKVRNRPVPGKTYGVGMSAVSISDTPGQECLDFMKSKKGFSFGPQGLTFLQSVKPQLFRKNMGTFSFDDVDALWLGPQGHHGVPGVFRDRFGYWSFSIGSFERVFDANDVILYFYELEE